jgi:phosphoserine aminotransferase
VRPLHFGAGPSLLPLAVIQQLQQELVDGYQGLSLLELGHRTDFFQAMISKARQQFRSLLAIPEQFSILFMHGGARAQFSAIPLFWGKGGGYLQSGYWSQQAQEEAQRLGSVPHCAGTFPEALTASLSDEPYIHYTENETLEGIAYPYAPPGFSDRLIGDLSSSILTKTIDWSLHQMIYAAAQKNLGIAGVTVVVIRQDILEKESAFPLPAILHYPLMAKTHSLYNTPPVFACVVFARLMQWAEDQGGLAVLEKEAEKKAQLLYQIIDSSCLYHNAVNPLYRSRVNIPFFIKDKKQEQHFLEEATQAGLWHLKGHVAVGGIRASLYIGMPLESVQVLGDFMRAFEAKTLL